MTRTLAIAHARRAGYHSDTMAFTRLIIESRVNRQTMNQAWAAGAAAYEAGVRCNCFECTAATDPS